MTKTVVPMRKPRLNLTFRKVWAGMMEDREQMEKDRERMRELREEFDRFVKERREASAELDRRMKETDRLIKENALQMKETDRQMKETAQQMKETDRRMKETDKKMGRLTNRFGDIIEHLVGANLPKKFAPFGFVFSRAGPVTIADYQHEIFLEIDILLEDGDSALAVEVKANLKVDDVKEHEERMEKLRRYSDIRGDKRKFYGAVGGAVVNKDVKVYALRQGFFVITQSGDTVEVVGPEEIREPRAW